MLFISQVAATFILLPVGSFMANRIEEGHKGRAAGWYQAGNLGGMGLGGGQDYGLRNMSPFPWRVSAWVPSPSYLHWRFSG